ncbi:Acetoacetyl-CoA reductase [Candidatus Jidaibacter acanthamoeba]|uniref:Acetoacetyl-CoA reductase n=2 Tax=Candidatus Jidaibacter acanthamoebae TaxID=86105 RepID=A0A0C1QFW2_9RICK|nr:Acetoacetyl-CoA reductase [Candidatus Jidaibacter acanthamoeba]
MMGRRALVTGGTRGIGKAIAMALKAAGHKVAVVYAGSDDLAKKLEQETGIKTFKLDVSNYNQCVEGVAKAEEYLGGNVEILVNNAGITRDAMMHKLSYEDWKAVIDTNLSSVFNMSKSVIQKMRDSKFGRIISMSSVNANGMMGQTNYSAAKAGIEGFTKALALESARAGITVNAVAPGYISTEMVAAMPKEALDAIVAKVPMQRLGNVEEIARVIAFLADDASGFITGTVIPVNGALRV